MTTPVSPLVSTEGYAVCNLGWNVGQPCRYRSSALWLALPGGLGGDLAACPRPRLRGLSRAHGVEDPPPGDEPTADAAERSDQAHPRGHPGGGHARRGKRGRMPVEPRHLWQRLPRELRCAVTADLAAILREVIHDLGPCDAPASVPQGRHLHPPIQPASGAQQPGEPAPAVRAAPARPGGMRPIPKSL